MRYKTAKEILFTKIEQMLIYIYKIIYNKEINFIKKSLYSCRKYRKGASV